MRWVITCFFVGGSDYFGEHHSVFKAMLGEGKGHSVGEHFASSADKQCIISNVRKAKLQQ